MGLFNKNIKIGEGQKYDLTNVSTNDVSKEETIKKNNKLIKIFNFFNFEGGNSLSSVELAQAMDYLEKLDDGDGKLSNKELEQGAQQLNKELGLQGKDSLKAKDLKQFVKNLSSAMKNDPKQNVDTVLNQYQKQQEQLQKQQFLDELDKSAAALGCEPTETEGVYFNKEKKIYIKYNQEKNEFNPAKWSDENQTYEYMTQEEFDAATKPKEEPPKQEEKPQLNKYTVQPEETFTQIIKKSLAAQGITDPTPEQISEAKEQFKKDNPNAVKTTKDGYEYLLVGAEVNLTGEVKSEKNSKEAIDQWSKDHPDLVWKPKSKERIEVETNSNGSTVTSTYDANGNETKCVIKDKDGNVKSSVERTYDANGKETKCVFKDKDGNVRCSIECTYDADGNVTKQVYKDAAGNEISEDEWDKL